jgi:hypothetical protein
MKNRESLLRKLLLTLRLNDVEFRSAALQMCAVFGDLDLQNKRDGSYEPSLAV